MTPQEKLTAQLSNELETAFVAGDELVAGKAQERSCLNVLQGQYQAVAQGDFEKGFRDSLAEDVEMEILGPADVPFVGRWKGRQTVMEAVRRNFSLLEEQNPHIENVVAQGNTLVVIGREHGRYRGSGNKYRYAWVQVFTFRDGKVARLQEFVTPLLDA